MNIKLKIFEEIKGISSLLVGTVAFSATVALPFVTAQSSGALDLDEVIAVGKHLQADKANALRTPTPIIDVPQSLSIVTADQMNMQGFNSIGDIIDYTPGVNTSQGEGHRDAVVFRGVRSTADFFIDGIRDDVQYYRPLYNIEQVEILRGPNALLFGRGGSGGILNRVSKKGEIGETFTGYKASVDTFGATNFELDTNYTLNEGAAARLNLYYGSLENHRDFFDGDQLGINPTVKFNLSPQTTLNVSYEYMDHERFVDRGIPTGADGKPVKALKDTVFGDESENKTTLEAHLIKTSLEHKFSDSLKGRVNGSYGDYDKLYQNLYASSYSQATSPSVVTLDGYRDTTQRTNLVLSSDLIAEFETGSIEHTVVTGVEFISTENNNDRYNTFFSSSSDDKEDFTIARPLNIKGNVGVNSSGVATSNDYSADLNDDTHADVTVLSAYLQDEVAINDMFDVILGARFDSYDIDVNNVKSAEKRNKTDEEITPRLGFVFKPKENISLYASYSETFLPSSGEQYAAINNDANKLDPDEFVNMEAGIKVDLNDGLSLTASVFQIEASKPEVSDTDSSTFDVIKTDTTGFELQLQGWITDEWYTSAGYGYLDGEQAGGSLRPRELPEHMFSLWNHYLVTDKLGLGLGFIYQDDSFIDNGNSKTLPSYIRLDAAAHYDVTNNVRIQLNVENLTDELYFPNSHSSHQATVGAPINALLSVSGRF